MRASERKESILASAAPLFNRNGFAGTSISDVLQAAALEKGGLYNHFASKEELAVAAFDYAFDRVRQYFAQACSGADAGLAYVHAYIDAFEAYVERPVVDGGCPLANAAIEADDAVPFLRDRVRAAFAYVRQALHRHVVRAIECGEIVSNLDADEITDFIFASLEGALVVSRGLHSRATARRVAGVLRTWLGEHTTASR